MAKYEITVHERACYSKVIEIDDAEVSRLLAECGDYDAAFFECIAERGEEIFLEEGCSEWFCAVSDRTVIAADDDSEKRAHQRIADRIDGYDRDDLGESPDY